MYQTFSLVAVLCGIFLLHLTSCQGNGNAAEHFLSDNFTHLEWQYKTMLNVILKEKAYETLLLMHQSFNEEKLLDIFTTYQNEKMPKVIMRPNGHLNSYKTLFNSEILAVVFFKGKVDTDLMNGLAQALDYMRQTRILIVAIRIEEDLEDFKELLLKLCETHKMTNVLASLHSSVETIDAKAGALFSLRPFPNYHWQPLRALPHQEFALYPIHWLNMHNKTLLTYPDQSPPKSLVHFDEQGAMHISGYVGLLVWTFAQHYNAHLQMQQPLVEGKVVHFMIIARMVADGQLDVPMSTDAGATGSWHNMSDFVIVCKSHFMVPLSAQLTIREVFTLLLNGQFFGPVVVFSLLLSFVHVLTDLAFEGTLQYMDLIINSKVMPGVLG
ncbi:uncharacterized protein LOC131996235 [Stomoxys calcitrans]|uniref:uncharacterized protein LOC131996235 n=1 Tax=Stomoxys calcitrans TaxID=35570 RepID=UPI0027E266DA|nr:uncharacterized protein LOC131996235 [Stomoxys calcitrans]